MRARGPLQGWDPARGWESASPLGGPPVPRCLIRALAGVSLEPQDFLSCGGKEKEVRAGSWGLSPGQEGGEGDEGWRRPGRQKMKGGR